MTERYYIVIGDAGRPMMLGDYGDTPRGGVLVSGDYGHLFRSRRAAQRAIERSVEYALRHELPWNVDQYRIERVREAGGGNHE